MNKENIKNNMTSEFSQEISPAGIGMDLPGPRYFSLEDVYTMSEIISMKNELDRVTSIEKTVAVITTFGGLKIPFLGAMGALLWVEQYALEEYREAIYTAYDSMMRNNWRRVTIRTSYTWNDTLKKYYQDGPIRNIYG